MKITLGFLVLISLLTLFGRVLSLLAVLSLCFGDSPLLEFDRGVYFGLFSDDLFANWDNEQGQISEGSRNSTMSVIAGKLIKRYGNTDVAQDEFLKMAETCNPPLPEIELRTIWNRISC